ncbi:MAG: hypothetical protein JW731_12775 [Bacteroidales bacterium]|nr:hypothetical protein [Bacteroidales bacterium]
MRSLSNLLLIAGTGRNSGKTAIACAIIDKFSTRYSITGIKISPHFHEKTNVLKIVQKDQNFNIYLETSKKTGKDTSKMLNAGAGKVFYVEGTDEHLQEAFYSLVKLIPENGPVVCESPALRRIVTPGMFIITDHEKVSSKKQDVIRMKNFADFYFDFQKDSLEKLFSAIDFKSNTWVHVTD